MKAIVFGGSGFISSHVADKLTERGYKVRIFDLRESPYLKEGQEMIIGNILDADAVRKAVKGCDYVYNFAGIADLDDASSRPIDTIYNNILGNTIILDAATKEKVKRFVYASSIYVYSNSGGFYRCSKQASELYIEEYSRKYGLDYTILRFGTVYGPRANDKNSLHRYLKQALNEGKITCYATGDELREYINVRTVAKSAVDILADEFKNKHIILTGHNPMRFRDMMEMICEILNKKVKVEYLPPSEETEHYKITPYSFIPKIGEKYFSSTSLDMGQGLLECLHEIHKETENEKEDRKHAKTKKD
jgi:UDP-glucose 4-epimerase